VLCAAYLEVKLEGHWNEYMYVGPSTNKKIKNETAYERGEITCHSLQLVDVKCGAHQLLKNRLVTVEIILLGTL